MDSFYTNLLTGLRIGAISTWSIMLFRYLFNQTPLENRSDKVSKSVNRLWLIQNTIMATAIIFVFSPHNILVYNEYISLEIGKVFLIYGSFAIIVCSIILLHMKDKLEEKNNKATLIYILIPFVITLYTVGH